MDIREKVIARLKDNPFVTLSRWGQKDEWGDCKCERCGFEGGDSTNRFCPECGSFMVNYAPHVQYKYPCHKCGSAKWASMRVVEPERDGHSQVMDVTCADCGNVSRYTFESAQKEVLADTFIAEYAERIGVIPE